jgi:hypothetical protein
MTAFTTGHVAHDLPRLSDDLRCYGDLLAVRRQRKRFGLNERIIGLLDKFPILGRLIL